MAIRIKVWNETGLMFGLTQQKQKRTPHAPYPSSLLPILHAPTSYSFQSSPNSSRLPNLEKRLPNLPSLSDRLVTPRSGHRIQWWPSSESSFVLVGGLRGRLVREFTDGTSTDEQRTTRKRGTNTNVKRTPSRAPMLNAVRNDEAQTCISDRDRAPGAEESSGELGGATAAEQELCFVGGGWGHGNRNGTTSTVPQKRKLGIGGGVGGAAVAMITRHSAKRMVGG
ncbi:hypothetical protein B0H13DRAFT_1878754 [Mycena leptocephala]|nr:hypothetical protein B0H13DRAFT_1878754 [Mycena leptocephala]